MFYRSLLACPFVLFLLAIVFSVLFRYTDYDYPFGMFKLFLEKIEMTIRNVQSRDTGSTGHKTQNEDKYHEELVLLETTILCVFSNNALVSIIKHDVTG